jgi:arginyl-tRNA synthetase
MNYLGDWGKQYGLLALAFEMYGDEEALKANPINHLFNLYVKINSEKEAQLAEIEAAKKEGKDVSSLEAASLDEKARQYFRKMTDGDEAVLAQWQRFRDLSIARYKETYARLNINFDVFSGESQVTEESMAKVAKRMEEKGVSKSDGGAVLVDFESLIPGKEGKRLGKAVVR